MISVGSKNIYDKALITKIKGRIGPKKLKKIIKYLRDIAEKEVSQFSELKIKIFEEEKKPEFKIVAPIIGFKHYFEEFKKLNSKRIVNNIIHNEGENTHSTSDGKEEEKKQIDSSDFSEDE